MTARETTTAIAAIAPLLRPESEPLDDEGGVGLNGGEGVRCGLGGDPGVVGDGVLPVS